MKDQVELFRYVRNHDLIDGKIVVNSHGGIVFKFLIDQTGETLIFTWCVCRSDENFNRKLGKLITQGRFEKYRYVDDTICMHTHYDRNLSLIDNVLEHLNSIKNIGFYPRDVQTLKHTLKRILRKNKSLGIGVYGYE